MESFFVNGSGWLLCVVQGVLEFLPVSSSVHLQLAGRFLPIGQPSVFVETALHLGTLLSIAWVYRRTISQLAFGCIRFCLGRRGEEAEQSAHAVLQYGIASVPVAVVGVLLHKHRMHPSGLLLAWIILSFGLLLGAADWSGRRRSVSMNWKRALVVGMAQVFALIPGVSRLGICLTALRFSGIARQEALTFSVLLSIPSILGSFMLSAHDAMSHGSAIAWVEMLQAILLTAAIGIVTLCGMQRFFQRHSVGVFVIYRTILGLLLMRVTVG
jgi:undecaprenyl-diphosphatase